MTAFPKTLYCPAAADPNFVDVTDTRSALVGADPRVCEEGSAMAYLEITLKVDAADRPQAAGVYEKFKQPFLDSVPGARSKDLLVREEDVQVLHGFHSAEQAQAYLTSELFTADVVVALAPLLKSDPEVRIYEVA